MAEQTPEKTRDVLLTAARRAGDRYVSVRGSDLEDAILAGPPKGDKTANRTSRSPGKEDK